MKQATPFTALPNTFIIGAPKCGTTAIASYLNDHKNVYFSVPKEPFYWCTDFKTSKHEPKYDNLEKYLALFREADSEQHHIIAEGSTRYLASIDAVQNIVSFNPDAKFIVILRNPIEVAQAYHMEQVYSFHEDETNFLKAWELQSDRSQGVNIPDECSEPYFLQYGTVASYYPQIKRLLNLVPNNQVSIQIFDDFKTNPLSVYKNLLQFLDIQYDGRIEFAPVNASHAHTYKTVSKFFLNPPKSLEKTILNLRSYLNKNRYPAVEWIKSKLNKSAAREPLSKEVELILKKHFKSDVENLSDLLGRDLTHWIRE